ncbi:MAG: electron transfer flavoprotein subunit alpha [Ignavibacteria bacterium GWF2_33_9]|nr:MAG: electron transfer flavoprotein subunit alpha [Ignavibacteria bacterium GWF2_33_9]
MKTIFAYLDSVNGTIKRTAFEIATAAAKLKAEKGSEVFAIAVNADNSIAEQVKEYGIENFINIKSDLLAKFSSQATAEAIFQAAQEKGADVFLFPATSAGLELAPRISAKMKAGYIADVIDFKFDGDTMLIKKPVYAGKAIITNKINTEVKVLSLRPNVFTAVKNPAGSVNFVDFTPNLNNENVKAFVSNTFKNEGKLDVKEADIIVSGGRGMKDADQFGIIEDLAGTLGAAVGASRAVVDAGWRPHGEQVGQTGKTVSPTLYIACGISGAIQHLAGMSTSKFILAVNKDKDAPIFKVSDFGIVGDLFDVVPKLNEGIKKIKG